MPPESKDTAWLLAEEVWKSSAEAHTLMLLEVLWQRQLFG